MKCPLDHSEFQPRRIWEVEGEGCPQCRGIWLSHLEIIKLYEKGALSVPPQVYSKKEEIYKYKHWEANIHCPNDNSKLETYDLESLQIDICPKCKGLWLDDGEIEKLWTGMTIKESLFVWLLEFLNVL